MGRETVIKYVECKTMRNQQMSKQINQTSSKDFQNKKIIIKMIEILEIRRQNQLDIKLNNCVNK